MRWDLTASIAARWVGEKMPLWRRSDACMRAVVWAMESCGVVTWKGKRREGKGREEEDERE
jgi:hypothetical protein